MTRIVVDEILRTRLNGLDQQVEFCDESGHTMGHFLPDALFREMLFTWAESKISVDELERRRQEKGGRSLDEILKTLAQQS